MADLLAHAAWLRRLAGHIVRGHDGADDAVQETYVAALRAPPRRGAALRSWLRAVLGSVIRRRARTDLRRRSREEAAGVGAETEAPPVSAALEQMALQRRLTELVAGLEEPYRSTIVMRYFQERSAADIARAQNVPEGTVRWRTKEALARLRQRLDDEHGGKREAWAVALAGLTRAPETDAAGRLVDGSPARALLWGAGALSVGASALAFLVALSGAATRRDLASPRDPGLAPRLLGAAISGAGGPGGAGGRDGVIEGLVLDPDGRPAAGATVTARAWPPATRFMYRSEHRPGCDALARSDESGRFRLVGLPVGKASVSATHTAHASVFTNEVEVPRGRAAHVEIRLERGGFLLSGEVADAGGGPIPGVRVIAGFGFLSIADARGRYAMRLGRGANLYVEANGYAPQSGSVRLIADESVDFELQPPSRLRGRVTVAGTGASGAGARVRLLPGVGHRGTYEESAVADEGGAFAFGGLPAGEFVIVATAEGLTTPLGPPAHVRLEVGATTTKDVAVLPGATVEGEVRDHQGRPLSDIAVTARAAQLADGRGPLAGALTAADGKFRLSGLPSGRLDVVAWGSARMREQQKRIEVGSGGRARVSFVAPAVTLLTGLVVGPDGRPVAGAQVRAHEQTAGDGKGRAEHPRSDGAGRFEISSFGAGTAIVTAAKDLDAGVVGPFELAEGEHTEIRIELVRGATVSGTVRWEDGAPAAGVAVHPGWRSPATEGALLRSELMPDVVKTNAQGHYRAGPFLTGEAALRAAFNEPVVRSSSRAGVPWHRVVPVVVGEHLTGVDLVVSRRRAKIAGSVTDPRGRPLEGVTVIASIEEAGVARKGSSYGRRAITRHDGSFEVEGLTEGLHGVWATHAEYPDAVRRQVEAGTGDLALRFARPAVIAGAVVGKNGRPLGAYTLGVRPVAADGETQDQRDWRLDNWDRGPVHVSDRSGRFELRPLAAGRYDIVVDTPDGLVAQSRAVAVAEGESRRLRLVAEPGGVVTGRVVGDADGKPIREAEVATWLGGGRLRDTRGDADGRFRLTGVLPGSRASVGIIGVRWVHEPERREIEIPGPGAAIDLGTIRLKRVPRAAPP
jgi:RNA polymerase sigma factor (sigma-70 family)